MKNAARARRSRAGASWGHAGSFAAAVRSRYGRGCRQLGQLRLLLAEPLKIHLRKITRQIHWSPSLYVQVDLPVISKLSSAARVDRGRSTAGTAAVVARVERTATRLQVTRAHAEDLYSRHRIHRPAAQNLPSLRQELVRPASVAAAAENIQAARRSEETWNAPAVQALLPQSRPEFSLDMNRITDQVIRKIDRRIIAARERLGRI